jgi:PKD repeat protein
MLLFKKIMPFCIFLFLILNAFSQKEKKDSILVHKADFKEYIQGNTVTFEPILSPLRQIAGAPKAFWENYWEFGDGNYSFKEKPTHTYKKTGTYKTRLVATNNYDDGEPPKTRPKIISVNGSDTALDNQEYTNENHHLFSLFNGFRIRNNRNPRPNEEMELIVSYGNDNTITKNGKLYLFYNDKKFKNKNFELVDIRSYNNEKEILNDNEIVYHKKMSKNKFIQSTGITQIINQNQIINDTLKQNLLQILEESKNKYYNYKVWNIDDINPKEEKNIFFTLKTTPKMLKDTSAILTIRSVFIPDRQDAKYKLAEKEMEIVTSHDPNKMAVNDAWLNYRLVKFKKMKFKIRFQNNGEGPATNIKLNTLMPKMFDKKTLEVIDMYPKVKICPDNKTVRYSCLDTIFFKDSISFQFKNIYLPGSNQKNVREKDSTKGFVKYNIKFNKDFHKVKSVSQTAIIFDKNPPIITNKSVVRFNPGLSIGIKTGYNYYFTSDKSIDFEQPIQHSKINTSGKGYFLGATFSPYKSYKWYVQAEIMGLKQQQKALSYSEEINNQNSIPYLFKTTNSIIIDKVLIDIVPASVRYNINSIIGLGFGLNISTKFQENTKFTQERRVFLYINNQQEEEIEHSTQSRKKSNNSIYLDNYGLFLDATIGASRIGPSVGVRYLQNFKETKKQLHFYAIWKF